ncbi:hypothetical protein Fmac_020911 [Flemingia macrophylla]|uniref:Uncharacterized protein n=1 Tax=Flemingia macrophylla TaxID=520843 RepID=A0ABD1LVB9_9FABA
MVRHQQLNLRNQYRGSEGVSICEECDRRYVVSATHAKSFESESEDHSPRNFWGSVKYSLDALYMFSRPYTMIASVMNIISMSLLAVDKLSDISPTFFIGLLKAMAVILPMTLYVNGVNQLVDIEIDKINKSYLPLASRQYSFAMGCFIVALSLILSYGLGWTVGSPPLLWIISSHFILGTAYSINLPLLRWKRSSVLTAMYIIFDKGMLFQLALFLHMQTFVFKRPIMFPRSLIFAIVFMSFFSVVIALSKDIPDIEGDKKFGVRTLSVRLGQKQVFWICVSLLEMAYGIAILIGATSSCLWSKLITLVHAIFYVRAFAILSLRPHHLLTRRLPPSPSPSSACLCGLRLHDSASVTLPHRAPPLWPPLPQLRLRDLASAGSASETSASATLPPRAPPLWPPPPRLRIHDSASTGLDLRASAMLRPTLVPKSFLSSSSIAAPLKKI